MTDLSFVEGVRKELKEKANCPFAFAAVYDQDIRFIYPDAPCYARISRHPEDEDEEDSNNFSQLEYMIVQPVLEEGDLIKSSVMRYLSWLLQESPWSYVYHTRDPEDVYVNGAIIPTQGISKMMMLQAATLIRVIREHPYTVRVWNKVASHMPPEFALMLGHTSKQDGSFNTSYPYYHAHSFVDTNSKEQVNAWYYRLVADRPTDEASTPWIRSRYPRCSWMNAWNNPWSKDGFHAYQHNTRPCFVDLRLLVRGKQVGWEKKEILTNCIPTTSRKLQAFCDQYVKDNLLELP